MKQNILQQVLQDQKITETKLNNIKASPTGGRQQSWSITKWAGFTSSQPQQTVNNFTFGSVAINVVPELVKISKAPGAEAIGYFSDINPHQNHKNLICGSLEIRRKGNYLFCIVQNTETKRSSFYIIKDDEQGNLAVNSFWQRFNPIDYKILNYISTLTSQKIFGIPNKIKIANVYLNNSLKLLTTDYTIESGQISFKNPTTLGDKILITYYTLDEQGFAPEYTFKGNNFDYAIDKSFLYICSGEEEYTDSEGWTGSILRLDLEFNVWNVIPTGKAASLDLTKTATKIEGLIPSTYNDKSVNVFINSLEDFNPSIIEVYKERLIISGAKGNPFQVKASEYRNMRNFVDNVLGQTVFPKTQEDRRKASTFFLELAIRSMNTFGENMIIGTKSKFYSYNLVDTGDDDLDRITPEDNSNSGTVNNKACKVYKGGQFYFASSYQVIPELSNRVLESKISQFGKPYTVPTAPEKLTYLIDETCNKFDVSNSAIGIYNNSILWSVAHCTGQDGEIELDPITGFRKEPVKNNITILYSKQGDTPMYSIWTHIRANYFSEIGKRGLIYSSSDNGQVYKINEKIFYIDNHYNHYIKQEGTNNPITDLVSDKEDYTSIIQTGLVGVSQSGDSRFSKKKTKRLYFTGGFSSGDDSENGGVLLDIQIYKAGTSCETGCCQDPIYQSSLFLSDQCQPTDCSCTLEVDPNYFNGMKLTERYIELPASFYHEYYINLKVNNATNFYFTELGGTYENVDGEFFDDAMKLCPAKDELGMDIVMEGKLELSDSPEDNFFQECYKCNI